LRIDASIDFCGAVLLQRLARALALC
jgi:hypothetical protein